MFLHPQLFIFRCFVFDEGVPHLFTLVLTLLPCVPAHAPFASTFPRVLYSRLLRSAGATLTLERQDELRDDGQHLGAAVRQQVVDAHERDGAVRLARLAQPVAEHRQVVVVVQLTQVVHLRRGAERQTFLIQTALISLYTQAYTYLGTQAHAHGYASTRGILKVFTVMFSTRTALDYSEQWFGRQAQSLIAAMC